MKKCSKCKNNKELSDFPSNKKTLDKKGSWCKDCVASLGPSDYQKHKSKRDAKTVRWQRENREKVKGYHLKSLYDISMEDYNKLLKKQNGICLICELHQDNLNKALSVDHHHDSGKIRGLLCKNCNLAIGLLKESVKSLNNAIKYLNNNK